MGVSGPELVVACIEDVWEFSDDGGVDWVGPRSRVVFVGEALEVSLE